MIDDDFLFGLHRQSFLDYDIETFPNIFTFRAWDYADPSRKWEFEISDRRNDLWLVVDFMRVCREQGVTWVGFNSLNFDYPVMHFIFKSANAFLTAALIYDKAMSIINAPWNARFAHVVWENDWIVNQIDLFKVHHFDNKSKSTSLKVLEFNMQMSTVEDLPFPVGTVLDDNQCDVLGYYNDHDVEATWFFHRYSEPQLKLRAELSAKYDENFSNYSDVKIGERILSRALEEAGIELYTWVNGRKEKRQTRRTFINLGEVIFPYVRFEHPEFQRIHSLLAGKIIAASELDDDDKLNTKGVFTDLVATVDGLEYKFGTGGLHASVEAQIVRSTETHQLVDVDVASYYPNLGIKNQLYPEHLGPEFCVAYEGVFKTRKTFPKGSPQNEAFKLALNGAYGNSNNEFSPFYDPKYTMSITINGQLLLCMLVEQLIKTPGLTMVQANTDGVTFLCPRQYLDHVRAVLKWWEGLTQLTLEEVSYKRMFIRDVNSYIAEKEDGKLKRIGAYAWETALDNPGTRELPWNKDWSARIVAIAAEAALVKGEDIRTFMDEWIAGNVEMESADYDPRHDFLLRTKVPRASILEWGGERVPNTVRYYIAQEGKPLEKVMPPNGKHGAYKRANSVPDHIFNAVIAEVGDEWDERIHTKNKSTYDERRSGIQTGWEVALCNDIAEFDPWNLNMGWYITEAEKLVKPLVARN